MTLTPDDSREHRPAFKHAVLALRVSHEGGVPLVRQRWEGNTSDMAGCQERAQALLAAFQTPPQPAVAERRRDTLP
jgi:hypothetical protein